jgi:hypothetical protein
MAKRPNLYTSYGFEQLPSKLLRLFLSVVAVPDAYRA